VESVVCAARLHKNLKKSPCCPGLPAPRALPGLLDVILSGFWCLFCLAGAGAAASGIGASSCSDGYYYSRWFYGWSSSPGFCAAWGIAIACGWVPTRARRRAELPMLQLQLAPAAWLRLGCTIHILHLRIILQCAKRGKHHLCEACARCSRRALILQPAALTAAL
jgi:hypothetical protein